MGIILRATTSQPLTELDPPADTGNVADMIFVYILVMENGDRAEEKSVAALRAMHKGDAGSTTWKLFDVVKEKVDSWRRVVFVL